MKLSFSTRGWFTFPFEKLVDIASEMHFGGFELYDLFKHQEDPDTTIKNLGGYVQLVHIRDVGEDGAYTIIGEGVLPIKEMMQALSSYRVRITFFFSLLS